MNRGLAHHPSFLNPDEALALGPDRAVEQPPHADDSREAKATGGLTATDRPSGTGRVLPARGPFGGLLRPSDAARRKRRGNRLFRDSSRRGFKPPQPPEEKRSTKAARSGSAAALDGRGVRARTRTPLRPKVRYGAVFVTPLRRIRSPEEGTGLAEAAGEPTDSTITAS